MESIVLQYLPGFLLNSYASYRKLWLASKTHRNSPKERKQSDSPYLRGQWFSTPSILPTGLAFYRISIATHFGMKPILRVGVLVPSLSHWEASCLSRIRNPIKIADNLRDVYGHKQLHYGTGRIRDLCGSDCRNKFIRCNVLCSPAFQGIYASRVWS